jgi:hypothetical protein
MPALTFFFLKTKLQVPVRHSRLIQRFSIYVHLDPLHAKPLKKRFWQEFWNAIAALVGSRSNEKACSLRWHGAFNPSIDQMAGRTGNWTEDEDIKLEGAVQKHGGKDWIAITALVPGRTRTQS